MARLGRPGRLSDPALTALLRAYPLLGRGEARSWLSARRALLDERCAARADAVGRSVSSGCAATGARAAARELADGAAHARSRLEAGLLPDCEACGGTVPFERLDSAPLAVRCTACVRPYAADTRWCR